MNCQDKHFVVKLHLCYKNPFLFEATVFENIRYGKLDATDEEMIEAAKKANAHSFIQTLKMDMIQF